MNWIELSRRGTSFHCQTKFCRETSALHFLSFTKKSADQQTETCPHFEPLFDPRFPVLTASNRVQNLPKFSLILHVPCLHITPQYFRWHIMKHTEFCRVASVCNITFITRILKSLSYTLSMLPKCYFRKPRKVIVVQVSTSKQCGLLQHKLSYFAWANFNFVHIGPLYQQGFQSM